MTTTVFKKASLFALGVVCSLGVVLAIGGKNLTDADAYLYGISESMTEDAVVIHYTRATVSECDSYSLWLWTGSNGGKQYNFGPDGASDAANDGWPGARGIDAFGRFIKFPFSYITGVSETASLNYILKQRTTWDGQTPTQSFTINDTLKTKKFSIGSYDEYHIYLAPDGLVANSMKSWTAGGWGDSTYISLFQTDLQCGLNSVGAKYVLDFEYNQLSSGAKTAMSSTASNVSGLTIQQKYDYYFGHYHSLGYV